MQNNKRIITAASLLTILLAASVIINIFAGSIRISPDSIIRILFRKDASAEGYNIIWKIRLPRILGCVLLGGALAVSGYLLQVFFHNPIAGPFVLGISSGAKMMVAAALISASVWGMQVSSAMMVFCAWAGALASTVLVLLFARRTQKTSMLIVAGIMIGYICSSVTEFLTTFASEKAIANIHDWSVGSFSGITWGNIAVIAVIVLPASVIIFLMSKQIGAYLLGEEYAGEMGVNIRGLRIMIILFSSLLAACVTAFAGPVSFVGIAVPHLIRSAVKTSRPSAVIPLCFTGGAAFTCICDLIARTLFAPSEMSISAVTGVIGAPIVIYIMLKRSRQI